MNREYVVYNLREAEEEIRTTLEEIENDPEYGFGEFSVAMAHLYHHINTAWHARDSSPAELAELSDESFYSWRRFPTDIFLGR